MFANVTFTKLFFFIVVNKMLKITDKLILPTSTACVLIIILCQTSVVVQKQLLTNYVVSYTVVLSDMFLHYNEHGHCSLF